MTKGKIAAIISISTAVFVAFVLLVVVGFYSSNSFSLTVYEEGLPIADSSLNAPENAKLTKPIR